MNTFYKKLLSLFLLAIVLLSASCRLFYEKSLTVTPDVSAYDTTRPKVSKVSNTLFLSGQNYLIQNKYKQWELYVAGDPMQLGLLEGALLDSLMNYQEHVFFNQINKIIPKGKKHKILKYVRFFNRDLYQYVPKAYKVEIYGLSRYATHDYDTIAPRYALELYLHAAHDIGHALVDLGKINMGCTSAALWGKNTRDGKLLVGRNLDFYFSDKFAQNKLISFVRPTDGIPFVSVAWPGFIGVVSGMNLAGLTITMNAGKSKIPLKAKEPISIVARDILQHASTLDEAIAIAKKSHVFVSEALLVTSAKDNSAVSIEMSPKNFGVYRAPNSRLVCTNHFQSETYKNDKRNQERIKNGHSMYRFKRMNQLLDSTQWIDPMKMAAILRNRRGLNNVKLGYGNEKAINQLLAHHGVIFEPAKGLIWISSNPYNLGAFTAYDLNTVFDTTRTVKYVSQHIDSLTIPADSFLYSRAYKNYEQYRKMDRRIGKAVSLKDAHVNPDTLEKYCHLNPNLWSVYYKSGLLYYYAGNYQAARRNFKKALTKIVTTVPDRKKVKKMLQKTNKKLK